MKIKPNQTKSSDKAKISVGGTEDLIIYNEKWDASGRQGRPAPETIDICICTFRRDSLAETLASLVAQDLPTGITIRAIVADNDLINRRQVEIEALGTTLGLELVYVHAPACNISIARNACLNAASNAWLAFIDDDEIATPSWIASLVALRSGKNVVFGIIKATYPVSTTPGWILAGDFHSTRMAGNDAAWNGYTGNVLIDRTFMNSFGIRFAEALGQTGGEDTNFFHDMWRAGASFTYAPEAIVEEFTPPERATLRWLALRRFRSGQTHFLLEKRSGTGRALRAAAGSVFKAAFCFSVAIINIGKPVGRASSFLRGMVHVGVVAAALGAASYREYAPPKLPGMPQV